MRVLLVEDHRDTREVLARLLEHWGFDVVPVENLEKGLGTLEKESFGAVVSDISLPDGEGYTLIEEAKRREKSILGIALSAHASALDMERGKEAGFDRYLTKPFDGWELRSILEERCALNNSARKTRDV
jgi:DNA-binding response OmpR family regulator